MPYRTNCREYKHPPKPKLPWLDRLMINEMRWGAGAMLLCSIILSCLTMAEPVNTEFSVLATGLNILFILFLCAYGHQEKQLRIEATVEALKNEQVRDPISITSPWRESSLRLQQ